MTKISQKVLLLFLASMCILNVGYAMNPFKKKKYDLSLVEECQRRLDKNGVADARKYVETFEDDYTKQALLEIFNDRKQIDIFLESKEPQMGKLEVEVLAIKTFHRFFSKYFNEFATKLPNSIKELEKDSNFILGLKNTETTLEEIKGNLQAFDDVQNNIDISFSKLCYLNSIQDKFYPPRFQDPYSAEKMFAKCLHAQQPFKRGEDPARFVISLIDEFLDSYMKKYFFHVDVGSDRSYYQRQIVRNNHRSISVRNTAIENIVAERIKISTWISDVTKMVDRIGVNQLEEVKKILEMTGEFFSKYTIEISRDEKIRKAVKRIPREEDDAKWRIISQKTWEQYRDKPQGYDLFKYDVIPSDKPRFKLDHDLNSTDDPSDHNARSRSFESAKSGSEGSPPKQPSELTRRTGSSSSDINKSTSPRKKRNFSFRKSQKNPVATPPVHLGIEPKPSGQKMILLHAPDFNPEMLETKAQISPPSVKLESQAQISPPSVKLESQAQVSPPSVKLESQAQVSSPPVKRIIRSKSSGPSNISVGAKRATVEGGIKSAEDNKPSPKSSRGTRSSEDKPKVRRVQRTLEHQRLNSNESGLEDRQRESLKPAEDTK